MNMNKVTIQLTEDQARWVKWFLQDSIDQDPNAFLDERKAFVRRLTKKINDQLNAES